MNRSEGPRRWIEGLEKNVALGRNPGVGLGKYEGKSDVGPRRGHLPTLNGQDEKTEGAQEPADDPTPGRNHRNGHFGVASAAWPAST